MVLQGEELGKVENVSMLMAPLHRTRENMDYDSPTHPASLGLKSGMDEFSQFSKRDQ